MARGVACSIALVTAALVCPTRSAAQRLPPVALTSTPCPAESLYQEAFAAMSMDRYERAEDLLVAVLRTCPSHPYAPELLRLAEEQDDLADANGGPAGRLGAAPEIFPTASSLRTRERNDTGARVELVITQSLFGGVHGAVLCVSFLSAATGGSGGCSTQGFVASMFGGASLGAAASLFGSWEGVRPGQVATIDAGSFWGSYNGLMIGLIAGANTGSGSASDIDLGIAFHGAMIVGTIGGIAVATLAAPRAGQIAFMNSGGLWGGAIGAFLALATAPNSFSTTTFAVSQLVGVNLGLTAAALASAFYPTSRWRMAVVDLASLLGLGTGLGIGLLASANSSSSATVLGIAGSLGIAAGFGIGLAVTHGMDHPRANPLPDFRASWVPLGPEGRPGLTMGATF